MEIKKITKKDLDKLMDLYVQLSPINDGLPLEKRNDIWAQIQKDDKITYLGAYENDQRIATCFLTIIPNLSNQGRSLGFDDTHKKAFNIRIE